MDRMLITLTVAALALGGTALASGDHDRARQAVQGGQVVPLEDVIAKAKADIGGQLIEAELEDEGSALFYEIKMITPEGKVVKVYYDARDGKELRRKERR